MQQSFSFDSITLGKIARGAGIAIAGALLTYLAQYISSTDFGVYTPLVVTIASILVNAGREYIKGA